MRNVFSVLRQGWEGELAEEGGRQGSRLVEAELWVCKSKRLEQKHFKIKYPEVRFLSVNLQGPNKKLRLNESVTKADGEKHQKIKWHIWKGKTSILLKNWSDMSFWNATKATKSWNVLKWGTGWVQVWLLPCRKSDALQEYMNRRVGRLCLYTFRNCQKKKIEMIGHAKKSICSSQGDFSRSLGPAAWSWPVKCSLQLSAGISLALTVTQPRVRIVNSRLRGWCGFNKWRLCNRSLSVATNYPALMNVLAAKLHSLWPEVVVLGS